MQPLQLRKLPKKPLALATPGTVPGSNLLHLITYTTDSTIMRYSTVPAINFEAHVARNRELIQALPTTTKQQMVWNPTQLRYVPQLITVTTN